MATYTIPINSLYTESGDDVYAKPLDGNFSGTNWPDDSVAAIEVSDTNVYEITLDETKGYVLYLNGHNLSFTANAGTDVITATAHGLTDGATVRFKGADLPAPLAQTTIYYLRDVTTNTFKVASTGGGAAIDLTDAGTGTMTLTAPSKRSKAGDTKIGTVPAIRASELVGEGEILASLATIESDLDAIQAKTDLIGTTRAPLDIDTYGSVYASVGSTQQVTITCNQSIAAKTVVAVAETFNSKTDVASVSDGSITKSTVFATFNLASAMTSAERSLWLSIKDASTGETYGSVVLFVTYDPKGD